MTNLERAARFLYRQRAARCGQKNVRTVTALLLDLLPPQDLFSPDNQNHCVVICWVGSDPIFGYTQIQMS
ncbi:hypothetical protein A9Q96_12010 [Rhodobacterales bacterium 52_120_T64]|nr:hypothetical protein A9Q96_12010 [Rhodobacterales bacterium 52_120_T64]